MSINQFTTHIYLFIYLFNFFLIFQANPRYQTGLEIFRYLKTREAQYQRQLKRLVKCNSFTFNPQGIEQNGEMIKEIFRPLEFTGTSSMKPPFEARGEHLRLSTQRLDKPTISLMTHIDTVYPEDVEKENDFTWKKVNSDMIIGPGTMVFIFFLIESLSIF
mgnify:CR=1 FL=1